MSNYAPDNRWVKLIVRIQRRIGREIAQLFRFIYVYFLVAPILSLKGFVSIPFSVARGHETILIVSGDWVVKIATTGRSTIEREYRNYVGITQFQPALAEILPHYSYSKNVIFSCLISERLFPVPTAEVLSSAVGVRMQLDNCVDMERRLNLKECPQILSGLNCVEVAFGQDAATGLRGIVEDYLATWQYHVGLAHGDFHSRNVMRDRAGNCRLIDLDCLRFNGVAEFDSLYFALEMEWSATGVLWTETLTYCFATQGRNIARYLAAFGVPWADALGFAFFLDRVGQDFLNYGFWYTREQLASVVDASQSSTAARNQ